MTTDGTDCIGADQMGALVRQYADTPQALADAITAAAEADEEGYRDDVTVVVVRITG